MNYPVKGLATDSQASFANFIIIYETSCEVTLLSMQRGCRSWLSEYLLFLKLYYAAIRVRTPRELVIFETLELLGTEVCAVARQHS